MSNYLLMRKTQFLLFLIFFFTSLEIFAQGPSPSFKNYSTSDGLPSAETFGIIQDTSGVIWFGSENGISSFDGYKFTTYSKESGLKDLVVLYLQLDNKNNIWICTLSGQVYYLDQSNKKITPYIYNDILLSYKNLFFAPYMFSIDSNSNLSVHLNGLGHLKIDESGKVDLIHENSKDFNKIFQIQISSNEFLQYDGIYLSHLSNNNVLWKRKSPTVKKIVKTPNGFAIAYGKDKDIKYYQNISDLKVNHYTQLLKNISVNAMMSDSKNGFWITTSENGIFYSSDISCLIYGKNQGLSEDIVTCIQTIDPNVVAFGLRHGDILTLDNSTNTLTDISHFSTHEKINYDLSYDHESKRLYAAQYEYSVLNNNKWKLISSNSDSIRVNAKKIKQSKNNIWAAGGVGFNKVNLKTQEVEFNSIEHGITERTFCVFEDDNGTVWVSNSNGLFLLQEEKLIPFESGNPLFESRIEDINQLPDGQMVFASKGNGVIVESKSSYYKITKEHGLCSNFTDFLLVDKQSIWVCTQNGLNHIQFKGDSLYSIKSITEKNGLPTNEINQVVIQDNKLWIATSKGLVKMNKNYIPKAKNEVEILDFLINNKDSIFDNTHLTYLQNNINIHFRAIDYAMNGKINYQFRLLPDNKKWTQTQETFVNLFSLQPNKYTFEIRSQNIDGKWSKIKSFGFVIKSPFWKRWWFIVLSSLIAIGLISGIIYREFRKSTKEHKIQQQISELERSALQAQMNPHFIFNCLNSIQNLILKDDKKKVIYYLGLFAKLVRKNLNYSRKNKISLEDDISVIHSYLEMEKLRFKNAFNYKIILEPEVIPINFDIPPMLVQPFVENAIVHGISKKDKAGEITIHYKLEEKYIKVTVIDNGIGIQNENKMTSHTSVGMKITLERLQLLDNNLRDQYIIVRPITGLKGANQGTKVEIFIAV